MGMAFLQTCVRHQVRGSVVVLYRVSMLEILLAAEYQRQDAKAEHKGSDVQGQLAEQPIPRIALGHGYGSVPLHAARCFLPWRAWKTGATGQQNIPCIQEWQVNGHISN